MLSTSLLVQPRRRLQALALLGSHILLRPPSKKKKRKKETEREAVRACLSAIKVPQPKQPEQVFAHRLNLGTIQLVNHGALLWRQLQRPLRVLLHKLCSDTLRKHNLVGVALLKCRLERSPMQPSLEETKRVTITSSLCVRQRHQKRVRAFAVVHNNPSTTTRLSR